MTDFEKTILEAPNRDLLPMAIEHWIRAQRFQQMCDEPKMKEYLYRYNFIAHEILERMDK